MRWFRDAFCEADKAEAASSGVDVYDVLERGGGRASRPGSKACSASSPT